MVLLNIGKPVGAACFIFKLCIGSFCSVFPVSRFRCTGIKIVSRINGFNVGATEQKTGSEFAFTYCIPVLHLITGFLSSLAKSYAP